MSMKGLMTEENETVHQIECEMQRLLTIITNDQELIKKKDQQITSLQNSLNNRDDSLKKKEENDFQRYMDEIIIEKDLEWKNHIDEKEFELFNSKLQLDEHKRVIEDYSLEIEDVTFSTVCSVFESNYLMDLMKPNSMRKLQKLVLAMSPNTHLTTAVARRVIDMLPNLNTLGLSRWNITSKEIKHLRRDIQKKNLDIKLV